MGRMFYVFLDAPPQLIRQMRSRYMSFLEKLKSLSPVVPDVFVAWLMQGTVIIVANEGSVIMIPDGTILRDSVVTGNLRILDH